VCAQELRDAKCFYVLYNYENLSKIITNLFYVNLYRNGVEKSLIMLALGNILIEVDPFNKSDLIPENSLNSIINQSKFDSKKVKFYKYETSTKDLLLNYSVYCLEDTKSIGKIFKFTSDIICVKSKPLLKWNNSNSLSPNKKSKYLNENHIAISFNIGVVLILHYESNCVVAYYKSNYGNIINIEYSSDCKLIAMGAEDDMCYIADNETNSLLYCLEGHKNYVSSIFIEEEIIESSLEAEPVNLELNKNDYNSLGNHNSFQTNLVQNKESTVEELIKNIVNEEIEDNQFDFKQIQKARTSISHYKANSITYNDHEENFKSNKGYYIYTCGYDGYICSWFIDYYFEDGVINEKNYPSSNVFNLSLGNATFKIDNYIKYINLKASSDKVISYEKMDRICFTPVLRFTIIDNMLILIGNRTNMLTNVFFRIYFGTVSQNQQLEEEESTKNNVTVETHSSNNKKISKKNTSYSSKPGSPEKKKGTSTSKGINN